jgi:hypothetical protein
MITEVQLDSMSQDERCTWLDSLEGDDRVIVYAPIGNRYTLVILTVALRFLQQRIPADCRLKFLEFIDGHSDMFSVEAIAQLEPACDEAFEIYHEAMKLGAKKGIDLLGRLDVFAAFASMHPSIVAALKMPRPQVYYSRN